MTFMFVRALQNERLIQEGVVSGLQGGGCLIYAVDWDAARIYEIWTGGKVTMNGPVVPKRELATLYNRGSSIQKLFPESTKHQARAFSF